MSDIRTIQMQLLSIEEEMRRINLWSKTMPSAKALASQQPFCVDTMDFHEWVQWILLPRLEYMINQQMALPNSSDITPMAEEAFARLEEDTEALVELIRTLDQQLQNS